MTTSIRNSAAPKKNQHKAKPHSLKLTVQFASLNSKSHRTLLKKVNLNTWIKQALFENATITIRFVDEAESQNLNKLYRQRDYATNVLTFCYQNNDDEMNLTALLPDVHNSPLKSTFSSIESDIVVCCSVIEKEANEQNKSLEAHYAHMIIHATLHAQGYRHDTQAERKQMEALEIKFLSILGFANPYI